MLASAKNRFHKFSTCKKMNYQSKGKNSSKVCKERKVFKSELQLFYLRKRIVRIYTFLVFKELDTVSPVYRKKTALENIRSCSAAYGLILIVFFLCFPSCLWLRFWSILTMFSRKSILFFLRLFLQLIQ